VSFHDPHVPEFPSMRKYQISLASVVLTPDALAQADCVVVVTDHKAIDWNMVAAHAGLVVDSRNALARVSGCKARVVKA
jgi:UDP-N-acetyl-D-glucosamine dehydrogenase